ncbi:MAG: hypothetical protein R3B45_13605 [Bdellovibrionota bacterium]
MLFAISIGMATLLLLLAPFFYGKGGVLMAGAAEHNQEVIERQKKAILKRYILDEKAVKEGTISKVEWESKKQFLTNRYLDASRRLDYLQHHKSD